MRARLCLSAVFVICGCVSLSGLRAFAESADEEKTPPKVTRARVIAAPLVAAEPKIDVRVIEVPEGKRVAVRARKLEGGKLDWQGARLGVAIAEIPAAVRAQFDTAVLPAGFGVMVEQVAAGSAAAKAGIKPFDILLQFDDQKLVSGEQLIALVSAVENTRPVSVTLLRKGEEQVVKVRVAAAGKPPKGNPQAAAAGQPQMLVLPGLPPQVNDLLKQLPESGLQIIGGDGQAFQGTVVMQASTVMATDDGTVTITDNDGNRSVTITDKAGKEIYSGPLNTADEWAKVPKGFRNQIPKP